MGKKGKKGKKKSKAQLEEEARLAEEAARIAEEERLKKLEEEGQGGGLPAAGERENPGGEVREGPRPLEMDEGSAL